MLQERARRPSKLDDYTEYVRHRITNYPLSAPRIYREIQVLGFDGKYTIFKDYIREIRPNASVQAVFRLETKPGVQAQVDWAECGSLDVDRTSRRLFCFSMLLEYSRMRHVRYPLH